VYYKKKELYEITPLTMAVLRSKDEIGNYTTYILEEERDCLVYESPIKIIDHACKYFGSSLKGRLEGTRDISNITHKAPIAIDPMSGIYFFPTASPSNENCSWLSHSHIKEIVRKEYNRSEIIFHNGERVVLEVSYGSMINQLNRTAQFRYSLENRMNNEPQPF